jgi:hypothetical protein
VCAVAASTALGIVLVACGSDSDQEWSPPDEISGVEPDGKRAPTASVTGSGPEEIPGIAPQPTVTPDGPTGSVPEEIPGIAPQPTVEPTDGPTVSESQ